METQQLNEVSATAKRKMRRNAILLAIMAVGFYFGIMVIVGLRG